MNWLDQLIAWKYENPRVYVNTLLIMWLSGWVVGMMFMYELMKLGIVY